MRIHLALDPALFSAPPAGPSTPAGARAPPLAMLGGETVLVELQGSLEWDGARGGGVVGVLGLDRPDRPTLHLGAHHLLHGKFVGLPRPYAVIRRAAGAGPSGAARAIEGDAAAEESDAEAEADEGACGGRGAEATPKRQSAGGPGRAGKRARRDDEGDDDEPPLFEPDADVFDTPARPAPAPAQAPGSSSPFYPSSARDYSSELDPASPFRRAEDADGDDGEDDDDENGEGSTARREREAQRRADEARRVRRAQRRREQGERTRHYEVIAVVRKKVVFALRLVWG